MGPSQPIPDRVLVGSYLRYLRQDRDRLIEAGRLRAHHVSGGLQFFIYHLDLGVVPRNVGLLLLLFPYLLRGEALVCGRRLDILLLNLLQLDVECEFLDTNMDVLLTVEDLAILVERYGVIPGINTRRKIFAILVGTDGVDASRVLVAPFDLCADNGRALRIAAGASDTGGLSQSWNGDEKAKNSRSDAYRLRFHEYLQ